MGSDTEAIYSELLVLRCRRRDPGAWPDLVAHFEPRLFYYVRRLVDDEQDASDVLQQTWLGAFRNLRSLQDPRALVKWLYRIAHHTAMSHLRRRHRTPDLSLDDPGAEHLSDDGPSDDQLRLDDAEQVHHALSRLPLPHRQVLTLHFLESMPVDDIADVLAIPPGTVKSRLHHARQSLRHILEQEDAR